MTPSMAAEVTAVEASRLDFAELVREHQAMIFSIAYHCLHDRALAEELALEDVPEPATLIDPGDFLLSEKLRRLVASLPERLRIAVILRYQEDLGPAEIARVLGVPAPTVRKHLMQAVALLREKLATR